MQETLFTCDYGPPGNVMGGNMYQVIDNMVTIKYENFMTRLVWPAPPVRPAQCAPPSIMASAHQEGQGDSPGPGGGGQNQERCHISTFTTRMMTS